MQKPLLKYSAEDVGCPVIERSKNISYGLVQAGMKKGQESRIGIYSQNRVEWVLVEQACFLQSAVLVPLYDTLGPTACNFILNLVEAEFLVCDTEKRLKSILDAKEDIPKLRHIVVMEEVHAELWTVASNKGVTIHQLGSIEEAGKREPNSVLLPTPSDLATICFTSGSTGDPKGVMLTHKNMVIVANAYSRHDNHSFISAEDVYLSYLPSAHVFDRLTQVNIYMNGGSVGFWRGDIKLLFEDICALKPTIFATVPRILNKVYEKLQNDLNSNWIKGMLLNIALRAKQADLERGIIRNDSFWDKLVLRKIQDVFGGKMRMLLTGSAPIRKEVFSFFKYSLGCYILVKGPTVMKGYFKNPVKTAEVLDGDGWLHTGDIGRWTENGALAVIDRKKNFLKLSQGEYISPEKVEAVYIACPHVDLIFVHGDSLEDFLVAVISPDKESLMSWCSEKGIDGDWDEICESEVVKEHLLKELSYLGRNAKLKGFEQVKVIHLHPDGSECLTPTMKLKREVCRITFKDVIQEMYRGMRQKT